MPDTGFDKTWFWDGEFIVFSKSLSLERIAQTNANATLLSPMFQNVKLSYFQISVSV